MIDHSSILESFVQLSNFAGFEFVSIDELGNTCDWRFTLAAVGLLLVGLMLVYSYRSILRPVVHISMFCAILTIDLTLPKSLNFITTMLSSISIQANPKAISAVLATINFGLFYSFGCYRKSLYLLRFFGSVLTGYICIQMMPDENEFAYNVNMTLLNLDTVGLNHGDDTLCLCVALGALCLWLSYRALGRLSFYMILLCVPIIWFYPHYRNHELVTSTTYLHDSFSNLERMLTYLSSDTFICKQTVTLTIFGKLLGIVMGMLVSKIVDVDMIERGFSALVGIIFCVIAMSYLSKELDNSDISFFCAIVFLLTIFAGYLSTPPKSSAFDNSLATQKKVSLKLRYEDGKLMTPPSAMRSKHQESNSDQDEQSSEEETSVTPPMSNKREDVKEPTLNMTTPCLSTEGSN